MSAQFRCGNPNRRLRILEPNPDGDLLNGIDYLEVLDRAAPTDSPRQRTLLVRLFQPVPATLGVANLRLEGGVRVREVGIDWVAIASTITAPPATAAEQTLLAGLTDADHVLVVRTASFGDFSTYRLSLVRGPTDRRPPPKFDPVLSQVDFSFKVECPSDFDCQVAADCPPPSVTPPPIDYLAKDFGSLRRTLLDRLSVIMPDWRERNAADLQVMLVELLAYAGDHLSYYQDAVATEAYLGTARRRGSLRRHARLLDYRLHEGTNARAWVAVEVSANNVVLRRQNLDQSITAFLSRCQDQVLVAPAARDRLLQDQAPVVFEPMHDALLDAAHNAIDFYTWGDEECCLPKGATAATLKDDPTKRLRLKVGDVLVFEEWAGRDTGLPADADPARRQAVRLTKVSPAATTLTDDLGALRTPGPLAKDPLTGQAIVEIEWHPEDALAFPLCVSKQIGPDLVTIAGARGNVLLCDHGRSFVEPLSPSVVSSGKPYRPTLTRPEITHAAPFDPRAGRSAAATVAQDPHAALAAVTLVGAHGPWRAAADLLAADAFTSAMVVEVEEDGRGTLRFGDGILGRPPVSDLVATYRVGRGPGGNLGAEAIAHVVSGEAAITRVRNPLPAAGGLAPEPLEAVRQYAPQAFRVQERAVTEADYAAVAERHPEVQKAVASRRWTGSWYTVFLSVDRRGGRAIDPSFRDQLFALVEPCRMAGEDLEIEGPSFVPLDLQLVVCTRRGYFREDVEEALLRSFSAGTLRDGSRGFFHPDNFTFGQPVYLSQVVSRAMQVPGVEWVDVDPDNPDFLFQRFARTANREIEDGLIPMARLEIARLDNSPSEPENGRFRIKFMGAQ